MAFEAMYPGECGRCLQEFFPGHKVGYDEYDDLICKDCLRELGLDEESQSTVVSTWKDKRKGGQRRE